jgi:hypothetical protein
VLFYLDTEEGVVFRNALVVTVILRFEGGAVIRGVEKAGIVVIEIVIDMKRP